MDANLNFDSLIRAHLEADGAMEDVRPEDFVPAGRLYSAYVRALGGRIPKERDDIFVLWVEEQRHKFYADFLGVPAPPLAELGRERQRGFRSISEMLMFAQWLSEEAHSRV
jgi:DNA-binding SARP family transcriptional activator